MAVAQATAGVGASAEAGAAEHHEELLEELSGDDFKRYYFILLSLQLTFQRRLNLFLLLKLLFPGLCVGNLALARSEDEDVGALAPPPPPCETSIAFAALRISEEKVLDSSLLPPPGDARGLPFPFAFSSIRRAASGDRPRPIEASLNFFLALFAIECWKVDATTSRWRRFLAWISLWFGC